MKASPFIYKMITRLIESELTNKVFKNSHN